MLWLGSHIKSEHFPSDRRNEFHALGIRRGTTQGPDIRSHRDSQNKSAANIAVEMKDVWLAMPDDRVWETTIEMGVLFDDWHDWFGPEPDFELKEDAIEDEEDDDEDDYEDDPDTEMQIG